MRFPISKTSFLNVFTTSVYKKIVNDSAIEYAEKITLQDFTIMLNELYDEIVANNYAPQSPENYLYLHKSLYVARIIPILKVKDEAFYYFICKYLEDDLIKDRVPNTFGGWRLGKELKMKEKEDLEDICYVYGSYNPALWSKYWKEFVNISRVFSKSKQFNYVLKLDISNFYDSINLNILKSKLIEVLPKKKIWAIDYLIYFLSYWNKKVDNYSPRSIGLPQTQFGDQSRLIANFYLQNYDLAVKKVCEKYNAEYVRYADDQLIFLKNDEYQEIMLIVNQELNKIGLNLNAAKSKMMTIDGLSKHYLYLAQQQLDDKKYNSSFNNFYTLYTSQKDSIRYDTYIKRILGKEIGLSKFNLKNRAIIKSIIFDKDFLLFSDSQLLKKIYVNLSANEQDEFIKLLWEILPETLFNSYDYALLKFFKDTKLNKHYDNLKSLLEEF